MSTAYCVIAGGGTAGHLLPGVAVAGELVRGGLTADQIHFVGSSAGIDGDLLGGTDYPHTLLPGRGIQRRLTSANFGAIAGLLRAQVRAFRLLGQLQPRVVLALGGYASMAASVAAILRRVPLVVTEQNARAGLANRILGRFARYSAVPFEATDLPRAVVTGNPLRPEVLAIDVQRDRSAARRDLGVAEESTMLLVFSGSLGSTRINEAVVALSAEWADRPGLSIRHVTGRRDWDNVQASMPAVLRDGSQLHYVAVPYEDHMDRALAAADLAITRAGGTTVAELAAVGLPSLLVPFPQAPRDHQTANAAELVNAGAAILVSDADLTADRLRTVLEPVVFSPDRLLAMRHAAAGLGRPDAASAVARLLEEVGHG